LLSLTLPAEFVIVFDPVTHTAQFIDVLKASRPASASRRRSFTTRRKRQPTIP
jgi:hypothetical protein